MLILYRSTLCLGAVVLVVAGLWPAPSAAEPATALYVGHHARLTAEIPRGWAVDPTGVFDYVGADGFVASEPVAGRTLDEACAALAVSPRFDRAAAVVEAAWPGWAACRVDGRIGGDAVGAWVAPHPRPFELWEERYAHVAVLAAPDDLDAIVATVDFSPDRVTPDAYLNGVLDIVEARAYWADGVDWPLARREALAAADGLPTVAMAQGALLGIVEKLRLAGDNHSRLLLPHEAGAPHEATGFGLLVGGRRVVAVFPDGPADRAGVRAGDLIEAVDGRPLRPTAGPIDPAALGRLDPANDWGAAVDLTLRRPGAPAAIAVAVAQGPYDRYLPPTGRRLPGGIGYVAAPHFVTPGRETDYVAAAHGVLAAVDAAPPCGWAVDLRLNGGGSYSPMISGLGPILGNGRFVGWRWPDGRQSWVSYEDGRISQDGKEISDYLAEQIYQVQRPDPPVAVLTGPMTGSAGEVATLAFVGRPDARRFGEPTAGLTTGVQGYPLFDGAELALATVAMTDRSGATHPAGVAPDEPVATDWTAYGTEDDPVLAAAVGWLNRQPACAAEASSGQ